MKRMALSLTAVLFSYTLIHAQSSTREKAIVLKRMIELNHFSPRIVDDSFSIALFNKVINTADNGRNLFTEPEYKSLTAFRLQLDDELKGNGWGFFDLFES